MFTRKFTQRIDGEDYPVILIDSSADAPGDNEEVICEGCGREVDVFIVSDPENHEEPVVGECLPCFFRGDFEKVEPR
jgi:hypothetical protein